MHAPKVRILPLWLALLVFLPIAPLTTGCDGTGTVYQCDCAGSEVEVDSPDLPLTQLAVSGDGCQFAPVCPLPAAGGGCTRYFVQLTGAGACHLIGTSADGRQATADIGVAGEGTAGCCGIQYAAYPAGPLSLTFPAAGQDGSASDGG